MIISNINRVLDWIGFRLIEKNPPLRFPVEFDLDDRRIVDYVVSNLLSMASPERLFTSWMACRHVCSQRIEGDFVECGVWRGGNSLLAADVFRRLDAHRKTFLFDTFAGMTAPTDFDVDRSGRLALDKYHANERHQHNEWCFASLNDVKENFARCGLVDNVSYVKGDILQTLDDALNIPEKISVLRLDTDWYESTKKELEVLYPRLQIGGVLIIDDYGHWGGAQKAVDEYFAEVPRPFLQYTDYTGRVGIKYHANR